MWIRVLALLVLAAHGQLALAAIGSPAVLTDTPTAFEAYVDQTGIPANPSAQNPFKKLNWTVNIIENDLDRGGTYNDLRIQVSHAVAPHAGEAAPNPATGYLTINLFNVVPGGPAVATVSASVLHPGQPDPHGDVLQVSYNPTGANTSQLSISIHHVAPLQTYPVLGQLPRSVLDIPTIDMDNVSGLKGTIRHVSPAAGGPPPPEVRLETLNWSVVLEPGSFDGAGTNNDIRVTARHLQAPHPHEMAPNPDFVNATLLNITPGGTTNSVTASVAHEGQDPPHVDDLTVGYQRNTATNSTLSFSLAHVTRIPTLTPWGLVLLSLAMILVAVAFQSRRKPRL